MIGDHEAAPHSAPCASASLFETLRRHQLSWTPCRSGICASAENTLIRRLLRSLCTALVPDPPPRNYRSVPHSPTRANLNTTELCAHSADECSSVDGLALWSFSFRTHLSCRSYLIHASRCPVRTRRLPDLALHFSVSTIPAELAVYGSSSGGGYAICLNSGKDCDSSVFLGVRVLESPSQRTIASGPVLQLLDFGSCSLYAIEKAFSHPILWLH